MLKTEDFYPSKDFSAQVQSLRSYIYEALGWSYRPNVGAPGILIALQAASMVHSATGAFKFRGEVTGQGYKGQKFELVDVTAHNIPKIAGPKHDWQWGGQQTEEEAYNALFDATNTDTRGGYEGIVLSMPHFDKFLGHTIIRRDLGKRNPAQVNGLKRVGFASLEFESKFEVYSDDQVEARFLISPDFVARLTDFAEDYMGRNVQCVFAGNRFHVALEIDDRFDFSRDFKAFNYQEAATSIINEIGGVFYLLEKVHGLQLRIGREGAEAADEARGKFYRNLLQNLIPAIKTAEDAFEKPDKWLGEQRNALPYFCEGLQGLLRPRF
ncbi:MAG: DUF3137 domain-containing protein [Hellea sp.]